MLHKTRGIVFRFVHYGESSVIVTIFTELFGLQSYIINGIRGSRKGNKMALFQPLTLLDLVVYHKENASIMRIKEVKCYHPYHTININVSKSAQAMFLNELINKTVKDQSHPEEIFQFLTEALIQLDKLEQAENFHLMFMLGLSRYLGFGPNSIDEILGGRILDQQEALLMKSLIETDLTTTIKITYQQRQNLLNEMLRFYARHIDNFGEVKSVAVLKEVLS